MKETKELVVRLNEHTTESNDKHWSIEITVNNKSLTVFETRKYKKALKKMDQFDKAFR